VGQPKAQGSAQYRAPVPVVWDETWIITMLLSWLDVHLFFAGFSDHS
jgi:hypothetical protein